MDDMSNETSHDGIAPQQFLAAPLRIHETEAKLTRTYSAWHSFRERLLCPPS